MRVENAIILGTKIYQRGGEGCINYIFLNLKLK